MVQPDMFLKAIVSVDVKYVKVNYDIKPHEVNDDVKPDETKDDVKLGARLVIIEVDALA